METLREIINILKIVGISVAGITFVVFMIKIAISPEEKGRYIKYTKHLLVATILITISLSLVDIPKHYYGSVVEIVDNEVSETTIAEIKDRDCQNRETIKLDGKWYVVTDNKRRITANSDNDEFYDVTPTLFVDEERLLENIEFIRLFSECQGTFKGYFAKVWYYRDSSGLIFPADYTYKEYIELKKANGG